MLLPFYLLKGQCELVGARCGFVAATYAAQSVDYLVDIHSLCQCRYALKVAVAASHETYVGYLVVVDVYLYQA